MSEGRGQKLTEGPSQCLLNLIIVVIIVIIAVTIIILKQCLWLN